jgi:hypothetical protein
MLFYVIHTVYILIINTSTKNALNKIQFMPNINLLHVSAFVSHFQGFFPLKGIHGQRANPGVCHPEWNDEYIKILKYIKSISIKLRYSFMLISYKPRPDLHCGRSLKARKCRNRIFTVYFFKLLSAAFLYLH